MQDKSDIRTFWSMNRTHSAVVRRVHIAHFEPCAFSCKASRTKSREKSDVFGFRKHIFLIHKLRKLIRSEKFFDASLKWTLINYRYRHCGINIDNRHSILNISLDLHHSCTYLLLKYFTNKSYPSLA